MRSLVAMAVSAGMVWTSAASEAGLGEVRQEAGRRRGKSGSNGDGEACCRRCGFCLEDGTKVPLALGRELSSGKEDGKPREF
jgi:hypothetical protein